MLSRDASQSKFELAQPRKLSINSVALLNQNHAEFEYGKENPKKKREEIKIIRKSQLV